MLTLTNRQARRFVLRKNGLLGGHIFRGKPGALAYVRQAGCVQFDPIDVCSRNADLALNARVGGYRKQMLDDLLYRDRALIDYFDKQLAILPTEAWPYFARMRDYWAHSSRSREQVDAAVQRVLDELDARGPLSSRDIEMEGRADWYWSETRLSRAVLETLYFRGELVIHHKEGANKFYARARDCLPPALLSAPDPIPDDAEHTKWRVARRIGAIGLLWNKPSDAFLGLDLKTPVRTAAFAALERDGAILPVQVEGIAPPLYCLAADAPLLDEVRSGRRYAARTEFLAPLDCMMWDRSLIQALFGFAYRWEIYTPAAQRKYGYYTLPILHGDRLVGRIEPVCDRKAGTLDVRNIWLEPGVRQTPDLLRGIEETAQRLCTLNAMTALVLPR